MPLWEEFRLTLLAFGITAAAAGVVIGALYFVAGRPRLFPLQRLRKGYWSGREVGFAFLLVSLVPVLVHALLEQIGFFQAVVGNQASVNRKDIWASPLSIFLTLAILFLFMFMGSRTRPAQFGMTTTRWKQNTVLGYFAFLAYTPVVLGFFFLVELVFLHFFHAPPEPHPLELLGKEALDPGEWALLIFRATVAATLLEEVFFRGLFQGWLRRASFVGQITICAITLALGLNSYLNSLAELPNEPPKDANPGPLIFSLIMVIAYASGVCWVWSPILWRKSRSQSDEAARALAAEKLKESGFSEVVLPQPEAVPDDPSQRWRKWEKNNAILAIFGSAMLWSACHFSVWPTPIPLSLLGIGLGYLAYRTQSLLPGIVVHALFNGVACLVLILPRLIE